FSTLLLSLLLPAPISTLFPYTTLFRSPRPRIEFNRSRSLKPPPSDANHRYSGERQGYKTPRPKRQAMPRPARVSPQPLASLAPRSEEHTSELQSRGHLVCRLLLEKKKK